MALVGLKYEIIENSVDSLTSEQKQLSLSFSKIDKLTKQLQADLTAQNSQI